MNKCKDTTSKNQLKNAIASINDSSIHNKLEAVQANADRLMKLSNELLDFDKIDKLKYKLNIKEERIDIHLSEIIKSFSQTAVDKGITLSAECPDGFVADYDKEIFDKVLFNMVSNALNYTESNGSIHIAANLINN